nr:MAG TPA: hypothetical protein [Caudoviricetes sp.]
MTSALLGVNTVFFPVLQSVNICSPCFKVRFTFCLRLGLFILVDCFVY